MELLRLLSEWSRVRIPSLASADVAQWLEHLKFLHALLAGQLKNKTLRAEV